MPDYKPGRWRSLWARRPFRFGILILALLAVLAVVLGAVLGSRTAHAASAASSAGGSGSGGGSGNGTAPPVPAALTVTVPAAMPGNASAVDPALVSFSIEQDRWPDWAGVDTSNPLVVNALTNLARLTGTPPWIRIGADSEDRTMFNPDVNISQAVFPKPNHVYPYPEALNLSVDARYYNLVSHLPENTSVIWGVNGAAANTTNALAMGRAILSAFQTPLATQKNITLRFLELGNEADLYAPHHTRPHTYTPDAWLAEWRALAASAISTLGLANSGVKLWGPSFAQSTHAATPGWSPAYALSAGMKDAGGGLLTTISQHHYSGSFCGGSGAAAQDLLLKANVRSNLSAFAPDIAAARAAGLDYVLGESNSISCHGAPGVSDTAAAALWTADYSLLAATRGVVRIHYHSGVGYKYSMIQPAPLSASIDDGTTLAQPLAPHVQMQYYGAVAVAAFLGSAGGKVVELDVGSAWMSGYAIYDPPYTAPSRALLLNTLVYPAAAVPRNTSTSALPPRPTTRVALAGPAGAMEVRRLSIARASDTGNVTWAGVSYATPDAAPFGDEVVLRADVADGVDVAATEAVMLTFLGTSG